MFDYKNTTVTRENDVVFEVEQSYISHMDITAVMFAKLQARHVESRNESQMELEVGRSGKRLNSYSFSLQLSKKDAEKLALKIAPWLKGETNA